MKLVSLNVFIFENLYSNFQRDLNFYYFFNNPKFLPIFAFQNLMKIVSFSMFLYDLGKNISIQVKSQNLYSFEFAKGFKFL